MKRQGLVKKCALLPFVLCMAACSHHDLPGSAAPSTKIAEKADGGHSVARSQVERGPVRLTVTVDPSPARLSDEPKLTIEIAYASGIVLHKPEFGSSLSDFTLLDFREPLPKVKDDRQIVELTYTLEPTRSGKIVIDPIAINFVDQRPNGDKKEHSIQSEPLTVEIQAAVAATAPSLAQLRPPAEPVPIPEPISWWRWIALLVVVLLIAGVLLVYRRKRAIALAVPPPTPRELAQNELQTLWERYLVHQDVKVFYVELTAAVRHFIERTTGVHAPEQTTQEFLHEISRRNDFPLDESARLKGFLESADLVKFAAFQPRSEDIEASFRRAKVFVGCESADEVAA